MDDRTLTTEAEGPVLEGVGLEKRYVLERSMLGRPVRMLQAVDGVDVSLGRGETLGIVGESGSGKSTVARLVAHLIRPSAGSISVLGREIGHTKEQQRWLRRNVQVVLQDPYSSLDPTKTVGHAIREPLVVQGIGTRTERRQVACDLLERVGLVAAFEERFPDELSGGQRQRVAIARALATQPSVIIADEPTSALDISTRSEILNLLLELQEVDGLALMVISHDFATVEHLSHRVMVMYRGRVVEEGPTQEVTENPAHPYTRALISSVLVPDPVRQRSRTRVELHAEPDDEVFSWDTCAFAGRCPAVRSTCKHGPVPVVDLGAGRQARCHFAQEAIPAVAMTPEQQGM